MIVRFVLSALDTVNLVKLLTVAGISAESGIATFCDAQTGLWEHYDSERTKPD